MSKVLQSRSGSKATRQEFEYLILSHPTEKDVTLDEYRIDLHDKTLQSDDVLNPAAILSRGAAED